MTCGQSECTHGGWPENGWMLETGWSCHYRALLQLHCGVLVSQQCTVCEQAKTVAQWLLQNENIKSKDLSEHTQTHTHTHIRINVLNSSHILFVTLEGNV